MVLASIMEMLLDAPVSGKILTEDCWAVEVAVAELTGAGAKEEASEEDWPSSGKMETDEVCAELTGAGMIELTAAADESSLDDTVVDDV